MYQIQIGDQTWLVEFWYGSKYGKRPYFGRRAPFAAVTECTVELLDPRQLRRRHFRAKGLAVCSLADRYSRRVGRLISLRKTLDRCGPLRKISEEFM